MSGGDFEWIGQGTWAGVSRASLAEAPFEKNQGARRRRRLAGALAKVVNDLQQL